MSNLSDEILDCTVSSVIQPRPPSEALAAFYSIAQGLLPGLNLPYDVSSTLRNSQVTSSTNFDINLPAGVTVPMLDKKEAQDMLGMLAPLMSAISAGLMVLGPVKVLIDVIIAIINVLCAFPDPFKMASALSALFLALIPLLGLFPVTAGLLILLETAKAVILILAALLSQLLPKMELIIENVKMIGPALEGNNSNAVASISAKICLVSQTMLDELAILSPINKILALINTFLGLGQNGICAPGNECCDNCPPLIRNPPVGSAQIITRSSSEAEIRLTSARYGENYLGASSVGGVSIGDTVSIKRSVDSFFVPLFGTSMPSDTEKLGTKLIDLTHYKDMFKCLLTFTSPIVATRAVRSSNVIKFSSTSHDFSIGDRISITGTGSLNDLLGGDYTIVQTESTAFYVNSVGVDFEEVNTTTLKVRKYYNCSSIGFYEDDVMLTLVGNFESKNISQYQIVFDEGLIIDNKLMTLGCMSESAVGRSAYEDIRDNDLQTAALTNNGELPANLAWNTSPIILPGAEIPTTDEAGLGQAIIDFANNPLDGGMDVVFEKINLEIDRFRNIAARSLCLLVSALNSTFEADNTVVDFTSDSPSTTIRYQPRSKDNKPLLIGIPSNIDINAIFTTTGGTLSDVGFDINTGTYSATITNNSASTVSIKAFFVTSDVCSTPQTDAFVPKELLIQFVDGSQRVKRDNRQYIQSAGGRRR